MSSNGTNGFLWRGGPESLIREVFARQPIWDLRSHAHHNRELVARLWEEISDILKAPTDTIKTKWKHLRDNFRTELKKTVRGAGDPIKPYQSQWTYFNDLLFLKEQMMRKITHNSTATGTYNDQDITSEDGFVSVAVESEMVTEEGRLVERHPNFFGHSLFDDNNSDVFDNAVTNSEHLWPQQESTRKRKSCQDETTFNYPKVNVLERLPSATLNYVDSLNDTSNDDDYHFLMSLLPYVKSLTLAKKMHLRLKLQEVVCEFIYNIKIPKDGSSADNCRNLRGKKNEINRGRAKVEKNDN
ncbi:hypothetical protein LSTR_LSTR003445 [Laodelphax striatellus]|uniref:MADF domain-containing protein n=1 Tax=Laodelphax striatellus TaxID=195883 RepID=A0A482WYI8_LAOST|nr:hypothetical protein LSTR_LSTR003445 [Laodelphax striatellus]